MPCPRISAGSIHRVPSSPTYDEAGNRERVAQLSARGVDVWGPERVSITADVPLGNIEAGASLINVNLSGPDTRIGQGSRIGLSGLARVENCQIGRDVELGAGSYQNAILLDSVRVRGFAEVREGTLLEEHVDVAHSVAFKNTVLTATVVTGSLINFCDIFMSGGTSRDDHSEVGSGAIHFNFDPRGDKWGSMLGDATGVLLRSAPIFIGGNSGLVSPVSVDFGAVVAAGSIVRRNVGSNAVHAEAMRSQESQPFDRERYALVGRKFMETARLVGNLHALDAWYEHVRLPFAEDGQKPLYEVARRQITHHIAERASRLQKIVDKLDRSLAKWEQAPRETGARFIAEHRLLIENQQAITQALIESNAPPPPDQAVEAYQKQDATDGHVPRIRRVDDAAARLFAEWLQTIAAQSADRIHKLVGAPAA
jgi:bifunctional UDP-N-acetylglucosamine pyrophosphorylase/glucosamine-1-phosphate N-acetyltransferase